MNTHTFDTTGAAYDATQTGHTYADDELGALVVTTTIKDGDVLVCDELAPVIGVAHTWPLAVTRARGHLHSARPGAWPELVAGKLGEGIRAAVAIARSRGLELAEGLEAVVPAPIATRAAEHTVAGSTDTRSSYRIYTHAVVGVFSYAKFAARRVERTRAQCAAAWTYAQKNPLTDYSAHVLMRGSLEAYTAHELEHLIESPRDQARDGRLEVLRWSMSEANARKALGAFDAHWIDVRLAPVERQS
jgi:hypothetical protein